MKKLDYDDVLIVPRVSHVNSRSEVDISVKLSDNLTLQFPLIASPMRGIVDANLLIALSNLGGIGILHRFYDTDQEWHSELRKLERNAERFGVAIGLHENDQYEEILDKYNPDILTVDVANGYTQAVRNFCETISNYKANRKYKTLLMAGNVCTLDGAIALRDSGVDIVRYGVGGGGLCTTRNVTGIGYPQISALLELNKPNFVFINSVRQYEVPNLDNVIICSDGGIRNSGDFVKSIVAGADCAMAGSLFGQVYESPNNDLIYGMASRKLNEIKYTQIKSIEGIEKAIEKRWSLLQFVEEFSWGIKSAGTYLNAKNLDQIAAFGEFIESGTGSIKKL